MTAVFVASLPVATMLADSFFKLFVPVRPLASMRFSKIPDDAKTIVLMPVFASTADDITSSIRQLSELAATNLDKNVSFAVLYDFCKSATAECEGDKKLLSQIDVELQGRRDISVLVRNREYSNGGFCARERKRGAIADFNGYLMENSSEKFKIFGKVLSKSAFVIVLDEDSVLAPNAVLQAVNTFLHPFNENLDLLAFSGRTNLFSIKTPF